MNGRAGLFLAAALALACGATEGGGDEPAVLMGTSEPSPEEPPPPEAPPGVASELACDSFAPAESTMCWSCRAPAGDVVSEGCAGAAEPIPAGSFCTAALRDGELCAFCCDLEGNVFVEACAAPEPPIETTCERYYDDGVVTCTRCVAEAGWIASDECAFYDDRPAE